MRDVPMPALNPVPCRFEPLAEQGWKTRIVSVLPPEVNTLAHILRTCDKELFKEDQNVSILMSEGGGKSRIHVRIRSALGQLEPPMVESWDLVLWSLDLVNATDMIAKWILRAPFDGRQSRYPISVGVYWAY
jgi:hypothetical protein